MKQNITICIEQENAMKLAKEKNKSALINDLLKAHYSGVTSKEGLQIRLEVVSAQKVVVDHEIDVVKSKLKEINRPKTFKELNKPRTST